ncbi:hypothetical protein L0Y40_01190 [Candidatus Wolfebacteria bacterium]|nr:hypothetical protein [Candidatus Wolfebacteria bacterium]
MDKSSPPRRRRSFKLPKINESVYNILQKGKSHFAGDEDVLLEFELPPYSDPFATTTPADTSSPDDAETETVFSPEVSVPTATTAPELSTENESAPSTPLEEPATTTTPTVESEGNSTSSPAAEEPMSLESEDAETPSPDESENTGPPASTTAKVSVRVGDEAEKESNGAVAALILHLPRWRPREASAQQVPEQPIPHVARVTVRDPLGEELPIPAEVQEASDLS